MSSIRAIAIGSAIVGGGGSGGVTVEPITITENGTTAAPTGKAYSPVNVNVPNSYAAGDEGKVVSNGALVSQTSTTKNANGTYNTTLNNEVVVNVQNSYSAGDEGKVVSNGALVAQTAHAEVTANGTIDTTLNNSVTINVSGGGGGGSVAANAVNFYDYDGTIVAAYSAADFANLTALPSNPDRTSEGLTAQGWNWSLADAKTYVASYGRLNVGQTYITTDGKTHVHIHLEQGRTSPMLGVCPNGTVDVDWGDGTTHDTLTGTSTSTVKWTPTHNYAAPGDYVIKLTVSEGGSMGFAGNSSSDAYGYILRFGRYVDKRNLAYLNAVHSINIGTGITSIGNDSFYYCASLRCITMPSSVTNIGSEAFKNCPNLKSISIPSGVTSCGSSTFDNCTALNSIMLPVSITTILSGTFYYCYSMTNITLPSGITSIADNAFQYCMNILSISIPASVTSIGARTFQDCSSLDELHFKPTSPPTVTNAYTFSGIPTNCKIYVPTGSLSAYTSASNYPSSSTYTYVEE